MKKTILCVLAPEDLMPSEIVPQSAWYFRCLMVRGEMMVNPEYRLYLAQYDALEVDTRTTNEVCAGWLIQKGIDTSRMLLWEDVAHVPVRTHRSYIGQMYRLRDMIVMQHGGGIKQISIRIICDSPDIPRVKMIARTIFSDFSSSFTVLGQHKSPPTYHQGLLAFIKPAVYFIRDWFMFADERVRG